MLIPVEKRASFAKDGFQFARSLVGAEELSKVLKSIVTHTHSGKSSDDAASTTWSAHHIYSEGTDYLLEKLAPKVSELVGSSLLPTCAYVQIYKKGGILPLHVDIPECEVTVTITLDYDSKALWPLFFIADQVVTATLDRGRCSCI